MELEEARNKLNELKEYKKTYYGYQWFKVEVCADEEMKQAIETVLQALDNSIPKEKVEKVFETKIYNTKYLAETDWTDYQREVDLRVVNLLKVIKQELLEE